MYANLKDTVTIISGASKGIGKSIAIKLANEGSKVILIARNINNLSKVKNSIISMGCTADSLECDVSDPKSFENAVRAWTITLEISVLMAQFTSKKLLKNLMTTEH